MMSYVFIKDRETTLHSINTPNTVIILATLLFGVLSFLSGYFISNSDGYIYFVALTLFGIFIIFRPVIGLYLMVLSIPLEAMSGIAESLTAIKLLGWIVLVGWLLNIALTRKPIVFPREGWYLVAFIAWGLISMFWTVAPGFAEKRIFTLLQLLGFYLMVVNLINTKDRIYNLFWALLIGCILATGQSFIYFREAHILGGFHKQRISVGNPNYFSDTLLLAIPFFFLTIFFSKSNLLRFCFIGGLSALLWAFFISMSRGAVLGLTVIVIVMLIKYRRHLPRLIIFIPIVISAGLYFMPEAFWERMVSGFTLEEKSTAIGRINIWLVGWTMIKDNPVLGQGLSSFPIVFDSYSAITTGLMGTVKSSRAPHNVYLETLAELGIVGLSLFLIIVVGHLKSGYRAVKFFEEKNDSTGKIITSSIILSFLGLLVVCMSTNLLYTKLFWTSMALVGAIISQAQMSIMQGKVIPR
jgi:putative inorganic carbon (hco3(-)) transporter